jgi:hypothetical protein
MSQKQPMNQKHLNEQKWWIGEENEDLHEQYSEFFFQRIAGVSVVNKYCSNNKQGNQVHFFWPHSHIETTGTTEIVPLPAKGDTS